MRTWLSALSMLAVCSLGAQSVTEACSSTEFRQFDFWIGTWSIQGYMRPPGTEEWKPNPSWIMTKVYRDLGGCALIEESLDHIDGDTVVIGKSITAYNNILGKYHQTWVDNSGNLWEYLGGVQGEDMILYLEHKSANGEKSVAFNETTLIRMVFKEITENSLLWTYEYSTDQGNTWVATNRATYNRLK